MFNAAGTFELKRDKSLFYTGYTPSPLCTNNFIKVDEELTYLLTNSHRLIGILEGMARVMPDIDNIEAMFIKKEVMYSCILDKIDIEFKDIIQSYKNKKPKVQGALSCIEAVNFSEIGLNESKFSECVFYDLYNTLKGTSEKVDGYREIPIFDLPILVSTNMNDYNPTAPEDILPVMEDLICYINRDDGTDKLIKISLIYYQFLTISPFEDENNKLSRMLINILLERYNILSKQVLSMSEYMTSFNMNFKDRMFAVRLICDYKGWVMAFLKGIIASSEKTISIMNKLMDLKTRDENKIMESVKNIRLGTRILEYIREKPIIEIKEISEKFSISYNTAAQAIKDMEELGILIKSNNLSRNRSFEYKDYLNIFQFNSINGTSKGCLKDVSNKQ